MQVSWSYITSWSCHLRAPEFPWMLPHGALQFWRRSAESAVGKSIQWQTISESSWENHCLEEVSVRKHYEPRRESLVRQHNFMFWYEHPSQNPARCDLLVWSNLLEERNHHRIGPFFDLCSEPTLQGNKADAAAHRIFLRDKFHCDQEESVCQPNSKGKALLLDDACISDVIPVKAGHETVDCELIVVTATFEPV